MSLSSGILIIVMSMCCIAGAVNAGSDSQPAKAASDNTEAIDTDEINRILALSDDIEFGEYLAGECASCHLDKAVAGSRVPVIHGAEPEYLVRALLEYRAGIRSGTTMGLVASGLNKEEIAAIAHYLALSDQ